MAVADNEDTHDWVGDCDGEGQRQAVRGGRDSEVEMMAAAVADKDSKGRQQQQRMATACKIGWRPMKGMDKSGRQETAETRSGNDGYGGGRWQRWTTTVGDKNNSNGGQQQRQWRTTIAVNNDSGRQWQHARSGSGLRGGRRRAGGKQQRH